MPSHILIVEDSQSNRDLYSRILTFRDYQISRASDGQQALDFLGQHTPDLIVLDLNLPYASGSEVLRWLKRSPQHQNTKVIVVTGKSIAESDSEAKLADLFLQKPVSIVTLQNMVARLLPNSRLVPISSGIL